MGVHTQKRHGMDWEIRTGIYTLSCERDSQWDLLYSTEAQLALCDDLDGWEGGGKGRSKREGLYVDI